MQLPGNNSKLNLKTKKPHKEAFLAVRTGLEPATSCVTGRHSNQLNYVRALVVFLLINIQDERKGFLQFLQNQPESAAGSWA